MQPIATDGVAWYDYQNCKNGWTDRDAVWVVDMGVPEKSRIRWGSRSALFRDNFEGKAGGPSFVHCMGLPTVSCVQKRLNRSRCHRWAQVSIIRWRWHVGATWRTLLNRPCAAAITLTTCYTMKVVKFNISRSVPLQSKCTKSVFSCL